MRLPKEEITRKLLHLFALSMPVGIYFLPKYAGIPWYVPSLILAVILIGSITMEKLRQVNPAVQAIFYKCFGSMLRKEEKHETTGSTWVIAGALLCSIIFKGDPWISFIVLSLFILGDAVAALVGISIGRIKIGKKSLEGSAACFTLCIMQFLILFPFIPGIREAMGGHISLITAFVTSFTVTVFELIPLRLTPKFTINDNLAVPVIAGLVLRLMIHAGC